MKDFVKLFFLFFALNANFAFAVDVKICEQGVDICKEFEKKDDAKYSSCMRLACDAFYEPSEKNKPDDAYFFKLDTFQNELERVGEGQTKSCEYGIKKCDSLAYSPTYYWRCMRDECRSPQASSSDIDYSCEQGVAACTNNITAYRECVRTSCNNPEGNYNECNESRKLCSSKVKDYWHCVFLICLGPVDQYIQYARIKNFAIIQDKFGIKRRAEVLKHDVVQGGVPENEQQAPARVDPEEWVRDVPNDRRIVSNPSTYMRCLLPTSTMECETSDIESCYCSDGSQAISSAKLGNLLDTYEEYKYFKDANDNFEKLLEHEFRIRGFYKELDKKYGVIRN